MRRLRVVLRAHGQRTLLEPRQRFNQSFRPDNGKLVKDRQRRVIGTELEPPYEPHRTRVEPRLGLHDADAGFAFTADDGPLNRRGPAIFRKQAAVNVEKPVFRDVEQILRQDFSVSGGDGDVELEAPDKLQKRLVAFQAGGLLEP